MNDSSFLEHLVKPLWAYEFQVNQIGSVSESIQAALDSKTAGWGVMVSHRSGETEDNFIADLSVGLASGQVEHSIFLYPIFLKRSTVL